jgi:hypothetical protein
LNDMNKNEEWKLGLGLLCTSDHQFLSDRGYTARKSEKEEHGAELRVLEALRMMRELRLSEPPVEPREGLSLSLSLDAFFIGTQAAGRNLRKWGNVFQED